MPQTCPNPRLGSWDFTLPLAPPSHPSTNSELVSQSLCIRSSKDKSKVTLEAKTPKLRKMKSQIMSQFLPPLCHLQHHIWNPVSLKISMILQTSAFFKIQLLIYIGVQLIYSIVLILVVWEINSLIHTHISILPQILFPYRLLKTIEQNSCAVQQVFCWEPAYCILSEDL